MSNSTKRQPEDPVRLRLELQLRHKPTPALASACLNNLRMTAVQAGAQVIRASYVVVKEATSNTTKRPKITLAAALVLGLMIGVNITLFAFSAYSSGIVYAANILMLSIVGMLTTLAFAGICLAFLAAGMFVFFAVVGLLTKADGGADL